MKIKIVLMTAIVFAMGSMAFGQLQNGSFESGTCDEGGFSTPGQIDAWDIAPTNGLAIDYICGYWQASEGKRSVDLNGYYEQGSVSQTFQTKKYYTYSVLFDMSGNPDGEPTTKVLGVSVNGSAPTQFMYDTAENATSREAMNWKKDIPYTFTADGTSTTLKFESLIVSAFGPALDNVRVTEVGALICHRDKGKPGAKTLTVGIDAFAAHIKQHGDTVGPCAN